MNGRELIALIKQGISRDALTEIDFNARIQKLNAHPPAVETNKHTLSSR